MGGDEPLDVEELVRENRSLREQRQAVDEVLRAVARSEGLQPVLDSIIEAATRLCHGEYDQLYPAEGDVFVIVSQVATLAAGIRVYRRAQARRHLITRAQDSAPRLRSAIGSDRVMVPGTNVDELGTGGFEGPGPRGRRPPCAHGPGSPRWLLLLP